jgi:hypothetical protein
VSSLLENLYKLLYSLEYKMKKGVLVVLALMVLVLAGFASAKIPEGCPGSMVAYWKMDGNAKDSYIHGYNGSGWPGASTLKINGSSKFAGTQIISVPDSGNALDLVGGFTIQFWFSKGTNAVQNGSLVAKSNYNIRWVTTSPASGYIEPSVNGVRVSSQSLGSGVPYFVTLTWNKGTSDLILYINGVEVDRDTVGAITETTTPLLFGENFEGKIDELAFYSTAFDANTVKNYYDSSNSGREYCYTAGAGGSSKTTTNFTIAGCELPDGGTLSGGRCSLDGRYYCGNISLTRYNTVNDNFGCSYENDTMPLLAAGDLKGCCPVGMYCNATQKAIDTNNVKCVQSTTVCSDYNDDGQETCEDNMCYWVPTSVDDGFCTGDLDGVGCSAYKAEDYCRNDYMKLGVKGYGTKDCVSETVAFECQNKSFKLTGCKCEWNTIDGTCDLIQTIRSDFYNESTNYTFACHKFFGMGNCTGGEQKVNWTGQLWDISSGGLVAPQVLMDCVGNSTTCKNGETTRFCGEEIVKLPGFSLFALITSIALIGLFYILRKDL